MRLTYGGHNSDITRRLLVDLANYLVHLVVGFVYGFLLFLGLNVNLDFFYMKHSYEEYYMKIVSLFMTGLINIGSFT